MLISNGPKIPVVITLAFFAFVLISNNIIGIPSVGAEYVFSKKWGTQGSGNGQFKFPQGIAVDSSGRVYVADTSNNRVQLFKLATPCPSGTTQIVSGVCFVKAWGTFGSGNGQFNIPTQVALDSSGRVYIADSGNNRIQVFRGDGLFIKSWGALGSGNGQFNNPHGIAFDNRFMYVADSGNDRIQKFQLINPCPSGTTQIISGVCYVTKWGTLNTANGPSSFPADVGINSSGILYVTDAESNRVQPFTSTGIAINEWGSLGSGDGQFDVPFHMTVDSFGYVYVSDFSNFRIQKFLLTPNPCPSGTTQISFQVCLITKWGEHGSADGQFNAPIDVAVSSSHVYVVDIWNNRIQEFFWKTPVGGTGGAGGGVSPNIAVK